MMPDDAVRMVSDMGWVGVLLPLLVGPGGLAVWWLARSKSRAETDHIVVQSADVALGMMQRMLVASEERCDTLIMAAVAKAKAECLAEMVPLHTRITTLEGRLR